ncbi:MAG: hypothetical protein CLLPBCKN_003622 [Chroococcidiopsis cubana SAG 39.79]|jgi:hypothetical protein|nr:MULTISPECIES: hypothetical protein [Chroococcidiopsis]MDZ4874226.1 hypothetical protein [Chroococcidiopsis cubana SAG 39.79]PSB65078.1 hypothetical protein C7B79_06965 [Chroococcidiopsis cubana CCALA 043]URD51793.1 hypothetical protein M5J74_07315 [Chroococcidiopsis sp. CCNUC1]
MHRLSTTAVAGMLALTIAGCSSGGEETSSTNVQPTAATQASDSSPEPSQTQSQPIIVAQKPDNAQKLEKKPDQSPQPDPKASQKTPPIATPTDGLIQPTNSDRRTQQVQKGRPDPFAELYDAQPKVAAAPKPPKPPSIPATPVLKPAPLPPPMPVAPPQPDLARGTTVLGVIEVGNQFQAIVQVPNEATSRYVSEGQRLADGQVTVKRIEMYPGSEPVVVLEQFGQEVSRVVGQEPAQANTGTTPGSPGKTSSSISVPSLPSSGVIPSAGGQNALPPSPPTMENSTPNQPLPETPSPEELKNRLRTSPLPTDDPNAQSSSESVPAVQTKTFLPTVQPSTAFPEEAQPTEAKSEVNSEKASPQPDNTPNTPEAKPAHDSLPGVEGDNISQLQSSTKLPSAQQSKQRLVAILTRSQTNRTTTAIQSNSKARIYRQELIDRLLKSK